MGTDETILFETERLCVRRITAEDLDAMAAVYGDAEAMRWVGEGEPLSRDGCAAWLGVTFGNYETRGYGMSAVELRETGRVIGFCGLVHPGGQPEAEIKYAFLRESWGRGFATEVVRGMLDYGARSLGLREIVATVYPDNSASRRVLFKAGMRETETRREDDGTQTVVCVWRAPG